jgi:ubiquinone/menaquinone biosynthesis C-methylase UbiE
MAITRPIHKNTSAYELLADDWDRGRGFRSPQFAARLRRAIVGLLQPAAGGRLALELGVGTGWILDATSPLFVELRGIDSSLRMLEICRHRIAAAGLGTVRADEGDAMSLDGIGDGSVDAIYAIGLLHVVPEPARVLAACARVLKPGGLLVVSMPNGGCPWHALRDRLFGTRDARTGRYFTASDLVRSARLVGLIDVDVFTWGVAPQGLTFAPAVHVLDMLERVAARMGLSRYMGVLTASFRKLE